MKKKMAKRLMERKLDRLVRLNKTGQRSLTKSEGKLVKKCTHILLSE